VNGKMVSGYTEYQNEDEIILRMGSQFRVKCDALIQANGSTIVHLIEIDDTDDDEPIASSMSEMQLSSTASSKPFLLSSNKLKSNLHFSSYEKSWLANSVQREGLNEN
jgi:hypothetical protein